MLKDFYEYNCTEQQTVEVSDEILQLLQEFKREDKRQEMWNYRHRTPFSIEVIEDYIADETVDIDGGYIRRIDEELLCRAVGKLNPINFRRLRMYFFEVKTMAQIAEIENVSHIAVSKSIKRALLQLRKEME